MGINQMESILDEKGRVCIPSELRKQLNLLPGEKLVFQIDENTLIVKKAVEPHELVEKARKLRKNIRQNEQDPIEYKPLF
jgi:AbrB family looped-hinge helix DNA binding protein